MLPKSLFFLSDNFPKVRAMMADNITFILRFRSKGKIIGSNSGLSSIIVTLRNIGSYSTSSERDSESIS